MGNFVNQNGNMIATKTAKSKAIQLYGPRSVIGRAIVLHLLEDDLGKVDNDGSRTTGNAGARIACGIIGTTN
jgi:superoxide dismutase, Cu-Zn family